MNTCIWISSSYMYALQDVLFKEAFTTVKDLEFLSQWDPLVKDELQGLGICLGDQLQLLKASAKPSAFEAEGGQVGGRCGGGLWPLPDSLISGS